MVETEILKAAYGYPVTSLDSGTFTVPGLTWIQNLINKGNPEITNPIRYDALGVSHANEEYSAIDIVYNLGTTDILHEIQTTNVLLCVIIFFLVIVTFFVAYYVVQNRFKLDRR